MVRCMEHTSEEERLAVGGLGLLRPTKRRLRGHPVPAYNYVKED